MPDNKPKTLEQLSQEAGVNVAVVQQDMDIHSTTPEVAIGNVLSLKGKGVPQTSSPVPLLSSENGQNILDEKTQQFDDLSKPSAIQQPVTPAKPVEPEVPDKTKEEDALTFDEAAELFGTDFTGLQRTEDGKFVPDASAYARLGIIGLEEEDKTTQLETEADTAADNVENIYNEFSSYNVNADPAFKEMTNDIKKKYEGLREDLRQTNKSRAAAIQTLGFRGGTARYAGLVQMGVEGEELRQANRRLGDLESQEAEAISAARAAVKNEKYAEFAIKVDMLQDIRDQKAKQLTDYNKKLTDVADKVREDAKFELEVLKLQNQIQNESRTTEIKNFEFAQEQGFEGDFLDYQLLQDEMSSTQPTSFREWMLAGGEAGTGKTFADFLDTKGGNLDTFAGVDISGLNPQQTSEANFLAKTLYGSTAIKTEHGYNMLVKPILARVAQGESIDDIADSLRFAGQSTEFTGTIREAAQQLTSKLSTIQTETVFDKLDDALSSNNPQKVKDFLKKVAIDNASGVDEARAIKGQERTLEFLGEIANDLKVFEENGGDTNIFTGTLEQVASKVGTVKEAEMRKIATKIMKAKQQYRRSLTGVAFNVLEGKEYNEMFPGINKTANFNTATLEALNESFTGDVDFFYRFQMGEAYDEIFKDTDTSGFEGLEPLTQSFNSLRDLLLSNPDYMSTYDSMVKDDYSDEEIFQILNTPLGFNNVASDTQPGEFKVNIAAGVAVRNNNPGNLVFIGQAGAIKDPQGGRFAQFRTPEEGFQALINDLNAKKSPGGRLGPDSTLAQLITVYAPPSENATNTYINQMVSALGISKNTKIKNIDTFKLAKAIAKKESSTTIS